MGAIAGGVRVTGFISPTDTGDVYPTHKPIYGLGGWRTVADSTARDAISVDRREFGMIVYQTTDAKTYQLVDSGDHDLSNNANWVLFSSGGVTDHALLTDLDYAHAGHTGFAPATRDVNTTAPLTGGGDLSADRTIVIPAATASVDGYLSHTDWTNFNSKASSFKMSDLGAALYMDLDPGHGITKDGSNRVSGWVSNDPTATNFAQVTAPQNPTWNATYTDFNNQPAVVFDAASSQILFTTGLGTILAGQGKPFQLFAVYEITAPGVMFDAYSGPVNAARFQIGYDGTDSRHYAVFYDAYAFNTFSIRQNLGPVEFVNYFTNKNGTLFNARESGRQLITDAPIGIGAEVCFILTLGAQSAYPSGSFVYSDFAGMALARLIITDVLSETNQRLVEEYLTNLYGGKSYSCILSEPPTPAGFSAPISYSRAITSTDFHFSLSTLYGSVNMPLPSLFAGNPPPGLFKRYAFSRETAADSNTATITPLNSGYGQEYIEWNGQQLTSLQLIDQDDFVVLQASIHNSGTPFWAVIAWYKHQTDAPLYLDNATALAALGPNRMYRQTALPDVLCLTHV